MLATESCSQMSRPQWWHIPSDQQKMWRMRRARGQNEDKSSNCGLRRLFNIVQDGGQTLSYACLLYFLLNWVFWRVQWKNAAQTEVSHIFQNVFLETYSTYEGEIWPFCSTCCINWSLQPVAKMLRHLTWKTLFLTKHRIKSHISKIKQLPSPSPIFNVVLRKFQHDLLLWPTLRREGGLKCKDLIGSLDVQIRYNVSSLFATGCLNAELSCYSISRLS